MRPVNDETLAQEVKYKIIQLNRTSNPPQQIKGIMGLIKLEVGRQDARRVLYYAIERSLSPETKKFITDIIKQAAKTLKLMPTPLFI
jgi:hypothetical protein